MEEYTIVAFASGENVMFEEDVAIKVSAENLEEARKLAVAEFRRRLEFFGLETELSGRHGDEVTAIGKEIEEVWYGFDEGGWD